MKTISQESLTAYNQQKENCGNLDYRKTHKLGDGGERFTLQVIADRIYGITGGHRTLTKKQVKEFGYSVV